MTDRAPVLAVVTIDQGIDVASPGDRSVLVTQVPWCEDERPLEPSELRERIEATGATVACMAADVPRPLAFATARQLDEATQPTGVVVLTQPSAEVWQEAAQAGIRCVMSPDSTSAELRQALRNEAARVQRLRSTRPVAAAGGNRARTVVVLSPKGGSGKTMLATNLAVALAVGMPGEVALVDLDCVFGDVASVLGLVPERTIGQLALLPSFDSTMLKVFLTRHEASGLHVLAGSGHPEEGEAVTTTIATQILTTLARDMGCVVVDTAAGLDERALAAVDVATDLVLLASLDVASIRNLGKEIDALDRLGITGPRRHFVINRADARVGLEIDDVEAAIGMKIAAALPSSRMVPLSMNQGRTLVLSEPESAVAHKLLELSREFMPVDAGAVADVRRGRLFRRRLS